MNDQTDIALDLPFFVGDWLVDPAALRIAREDYEVKIEPKVMEVLLCLVQSAGQVVSRQQIEAAVWQDVIVGYDSLGSTIIKLRKAFNDDSRQASIIETVPKKGYRLIPPIKQVSAGGSAQRVASGKESSDQKPDKHENLFKIGVVALLIIAGTIVYFVLQTKPAPEEKIARTDVPTLAVLPFKNLSDDPQQEYFSDGIASDLITDLSKLVGIAVIARNSTFTYKNTNVDVRQLSEELNVDYVIEGSVRKIDNKVRISARLINARDGINVWEDRYFLETFLFLNMDI